MIVYMRVSRYVYQATSLGVYKFSEDAGGPDSGLGSATVAHLYGHRLSRSSFGATLLLFSMAGMGFSPGLDLRIVRSPSLLNDNATNISFRNRALFLHILPLGSTYK
jgi:hypothetical protein